MVRQNEGRSDYLRICGSLHGITATAGGTSSVRFCVRNFFLQKYVLEILDQKVWPRREVVLRLGGSILLRSSPKNHAALTTRIQCFCSKTSLRRKFSFALDMDKFEDRPLAVFTSLSSFSLVKSVFSNFHKQGIHLQTETCMFRSENIFSTVSYALLS